MSHYSEPHRSYHTAGHVAHCLSQHDLAADLMDDADAVELAVWFHDAIYEPGAPDNERRSADLFLRYAGDPPDGDCDAGEVGTEDVRRKVYDLILATVHKKPPQSRDQAFMVDIDLSGFGLPWEEFRRDSEAVRSEYAHLPDQRYFRAQCAFLRSLLERPSFYFTDYFRRRYEARARENVERYLEEVAARGTG